MSHNNGEIVVSNNLWVKIIDGKVKGKESFYESLIEFYESLSNHELESLIKSVKVYRHELEDQSIVNYEYEFEGRRINLDYMGVFGINWGCLE